MTHDLMCTWLGFLENVMSHAEKNLETLTKAVHSDERKTSEWMNKLCDQ